MSQNGTPVMRPMWMEFPTDQVTFANDEQYLFGDSMLVAPLTYFRELKYDNTKLKNNL